MPKPIRDKALGIGDLNMKTRLSSQRLRMTENVQALWRRNSAGLHQGIDFESSIMSDFDLDEI